jgi:N4-gp56 family major capsid protein
MANNFVDVVSQAQVIATAYSSEVLKPLRPNYVFDQVAKRKVWEMSRPPIKGDVLQFPVLGAIAANTAALDPTASAITGSVKTVYTRRNVTLNLYGDHATIDTLQLPAESFVEVAGDVAWSLTDQAMNSMNLVARAALTNNKFANETSGTLSTTYHFYGSDATASTMGPLKAIDVRKIKEKMLSDNVQPFENGMYVCILHPAVSTQLRAETGNASWGAAVLAGDSAVQRRFNGSIGNFEGIEFVVNNQVPNLTNTATSYFIGADALGKGIGSELRIKPKSSMSGNHDNLLTIYWDSLVGYRIIRRESCRVLSSTNTVL